MQVISRSKPVRRFAYEVVRAPLALAVLFLMIQVNCAAAFEMRRAINVAQWFTWPRYERPPSTGIAWPPYKETPKPPDLSELKRLKQTGFDTVRLPVDPAPFFVFEGEQQQFVYKRLFDAIDRIQSAGMNVIVDLHPNSRHPVWGQHAMIKGVGTPAFDKFSDLIEDMARRLSSRHQNVALELINEPRLKCKGDDQAKWDALAKTLVDRARKGSPDLTLVLTGACVSSFEGLLALDPKKFGDDKIIYTFHFYDPFSFTHQGAQFIPWPDKYLDEVPWPASARPMEQPLAKTLQRVAEAKIDTLDRDKASVGAQANLKKFYASKADREFIRDRFARVSEWARENGVDPARIFIGEFGVLKKRPGLAGALCEDRDRWLKDVRVTAEEFGFTWAYFNYDGPFALLVDEKKRNFDPSILAALGLGKETKACRD
ncbi:cellulase (glycosyl hydrolase family 5) [Pseudorhodoplanes sinuspersici]|nr:cellulase (glycosyl hydrolase family 5) [Pseudorhodoplanes sinuspersici]